MLDIKFVRENPDIVRKAINTRSVDKKKADLDKLLKLDHEKRKIQMAGDELRAKRGQITEKAQGKPDEKTLNILSELKKEITNNENKLRSILDSWQEIQDWLPNIPLEEVPEGKDESENHIYKVWTPKEGYIKVKNPAKLEDAKKHMPEFGIHADKKFQAKPHWEIGASLDLIDTEASAQVSGSRFYYLKNEGVTITEGVFDLLRKKLLKEGFMPMYVPVMAKRRTLYGTSHFPGDEDQVYQLKKDHIEEKEQLYLVGSSEPTLFAYYMDKVIDKSEFPIKIMAKTSCFRTEVGSWGRDVRGIKRAHQFEKLEMDMIIENDLEKARETHEYLLGINEWLLQTLELPYQIINMCTGDLGYYAAAKKYDPEVWLPSMKEFMETMSDSITTDYQARRLNIRYKDDSEMKFAYTLNDTGATHRFLIAILDHYQQSDGSVLVPKSLQDYVGKEKIEAK